MNLRALLAAVGWTKRRLAAEREGKADYDLGHLLFGDDAGDGVEGAVRAVALDAAQGEGEAAVGVGDGDADAAVADVEAEDGALCHCEPDAVGRGDPDGLLRRQPGFFMNS